MSGASTTNAESLTPVPLRFEMSGRIRNITRLKQWQMAIAEAVKNSMDAIAESGTPGTIQIEVLRAGDLGSSGDGKCLVSAVKIRDTGVGFNEQNYLSFCTPDSRQKQRQGGKGLGRLTCLQAFQRIRIHSIF